MRLGTNNEWLSKLNEMLSQRQGDAKKQKSIGKRKIWKNTARRRKVKEAPGGPEAYSTGRFPHDESQLRKCSRRSASAYQSPEV